MAKFMDIHNGFIGVTELQLREAVGRDLAVEAEEPPTVVQPNLTGVAVSWPETREQTPC